MTAPDSHTSQMPCWWCVCASDHQSLSTQTHTHRQTGTHTHPLSQKNMFSTHVDRRTHTHTHTCSATHMFLVSNVSSAVAGDKSITGTEVQGGKRLSGPLFPALLIPFYWHPRRAVSQNPGTAMDWKWMIERGGRVTFTVISAPHTHTLPPTPPRSSTADKCDDIDS